MTITITLSEALLKKLAEQAKTAGLPVEDYAKQVLEKSAETRIIGADDPALTERTRYFLKKNAELYRRLA